MPGRLMIEAPSGLPHLTWSSRRGCDLRIVYYLERADGLVKIGTTGNYPQRRAALRRQHGVLSLIAWEAGNFTQERRRHAQFWWDRVSFQAEWFYLSPTLLSHVMNLRAELTWRGLA